MPRGDQVARLYTLVMDLARTKRGLTAAALARRRNLGVRTVYRDLHALEAAGFPITSGDGAQWKLIDGWEGRVPFPMPLGQLLALHLARELMKPIRGTPVARELDVLYNCDRRVDSDSDCDRTRHRKCDGDRGDGYAGGQSNAIANGHTRRLPRRLRRRWRCNRRRVDHGRQNRTRRHRSGSNAWPSTPMPAVRQRLTS